MIDRTVLARLTAELVSSYIGNPSISDGELDKAIEHLPILISKVHEALLGIVDIPGGDDEPVQRKPSASSSLASRNQHNEPIAQVVAKADIEQTVFHDYLVCLEDGQKFKTLKRHLAAHHHLTPEEYRRKWGLPEDYPMAAAAYSSARAEVAKKIGLGAHGRGGAPAKLARSKSRASRAK